MIHATHPRTFREWLAVAPKSAGRDGHSVAIHRGTSPQAKGSSAAGGYLTSDAAMQSLDAALLETSPILNVCSTHTTANSNAMPIPTCAETEVASLVAENAVRIDSESIVFGQCVLGAYAYNSGTLLMSHERLEDTTLSTRDWFGIHGRRIGRAINSAFTVDNGSAKPTGVLQTAADSGITSAATTFATLVAVVVTLRPRPAERARVGGRISSRMSKDANHSRPSHDFWH